jgi:hypothetical protein
LLLNSEDLKRFLEQPLPTVEKQLENLVAWLRLQLRDDFFGQISITPEFLAGVVGAVDRDRVKILIEHGVSERIFRANGDSLGLSPKGWQLQDNGTTQARVAPGASMDQTEWDAFICHASEDKDEFVRPLAVKLRDHGLSLWLDEFTLTVGDSLRQSIDKGLSKSRFGIVVISPNFLAKHWPQTELNGLVARESHGQKIILPVLHNITIDGIRNWSPLLADRLAVSSTTGLDNVANELLKAIRRDDNAAVNRSNSDGPIVPAASIKSLLACSRKLHSERTAKIAAGKAPVQLLRSDLLAMHVVPSTVLDEGPVQSFDKIAKSPNKFPPLKVSHATNFKINYQGLLIGTNEESLSKPQRAYVQIFRNGVVESCATSLAKGQEREFLELPYVEAIIIKYAFEYTTSLDSLGVLPPYAVLASLAGVKEVRFLQDLILGNALPEDIPCEVLSENILQFGEVVLDSVPRDFKECARRLKPILTHLANAAGLASSPSFDDDGNYTRNLG